VNDPTGTYGFAYDNMGRLIGTTTQYTFLPGTNFTNAYSYDANSNRVGYTAPDGSTNTYTYDTLNRLTTLANSWAGTFGFSYDSLSRRTQLTRPNGITTTYNYDSLSRLLSVLHRLRPARALGKPYKGGPQGAPWRVLGPRSTIDGASYTLDAAGNRTAKVNDLSGLPAGQAGGATTNFGYDAIYELLNATQGGNTTESYSYDPVGNRLSSLGVASYSYNVSNEMTSNSNASYTYDYNGNTTSKTVSGNTTNYSWDYENRLAQVTLPGTGGTVTLKYDPFGRRIEKISPNATSIFAYDGDNLIETVNGSGTLVARYTQTQNVDEPLAMQRGTSTDYYQADGLGSITSLSSSAGALANTYTYDSFGNLTNSTGSVTNFLEYTGREFDTETSLYFYRARYYDPTNGRFLSEDPDRFTAGPNFYPYATNNPVLLIDPWGLQQQGPPVYDPNGPWNNPYGPLAPQLWNNCFSYAWNRIFAPIPGHGPTMPQPGNGTDKPLNPDPQKLTCKTLEASAMASGFILDPGGSCCPEGYHKVLPFIGKNVHEPGGPDLGPDYHWYRQDSNGLWSSKHGQLPVGPQVSDPTKDARSWGYNKSCDAMCAPN